MNRAIWRNPAARLELITTTLTAWGPAITFTPRSAPIGSSCCAATEDSGAIRSNVIIVTAKPIFLSLMLVIPVYL